MIDSSKPTALMLGRYQPFHDGHYALAQEALKRAGQLCIAVRDTAGTPGNPFDFDAVASKIKEKFVEKEGSFDDTKIQIISLPNITNVIYGRDVGYKIEQVELSPELQAISATKIRKELGIV